MDKAIVHLDLDTFFVSCERRANDALRNIPLIIGGTNGRGVVTCASMEARRYGVRSGMPQFMANKLCPQAKVIRGDYELYSKCSDTVTEIIQDSAPLMEKSSIDEFYLDISGMDKYFGCFKWTNELQHRIVSESGLPISFGLSINKTVSKMATNEGKPRGNLKIDPSDVMAKLLGKTGITLSQRSRGIDHTPVKPYSKRKSISSERTFQQDTIDKHLLHTILTGMIEDLCFKLRSTKYTSDECGSDSSVSHSTNSYEASTRSIYSMIPKTRSVSIRPWITSRSDSTQDACNGRQASTHQSVVVEISLPSTEQKIHLSSCHRISPPHQVLMVDFRHSAVTIK